MRILLLASAFNGLTQRAYCELREMDYEVFVSVTSNGIVDIDPVYDFDPDLILCPFLKDKIPKSLYENYTCLIVHPGVKGDRGPSSLDWSVMHSENFWGVTLLEASDEMDAGDIWGTQVFTMRDTSKASLYRHEVASTAIDLIKGALGDFIFNSFTPVPLNYDDADVIGSLMPQIRLADREIYWNEHTTEDVFKRINSADSHPGLRVKLWGEEVYLYGVSTVTDDRELEGCLDRRRSRLGVPGEPIAQSHGAVCIATKDGAIWVKQMKRFGEGSFKLPASQVLNTIDARQASQIRYIPRSRDISTVVEGKVATITFDFYNGAMNTQQCRALMSELISVKQMDVNVIVLAGGADFWSNGIHLNCIEAAECAAKESWANINAMNDLVLEIINSPSQITVAAINANAGAGGVMLALSCDRVVAREGVVLNPHYAMMGLYGSEYWTYLLPRRVGKMQAEALTHNCLPVLASKGLSIGMLDEVFSGDPALFVNVLRSYCKELAIASNTRDILAFTNLQRENDEEEKPLARYRAEELSIMHEQFFNLESDYHHRRYNFVMKVNTGCLPPGLAYVPEKIREGLV